MQDINYYNKLNVNKIIHQPLISEIKRILQNTKNIYYSESNVDTWTINEMYSFFQTMYLDFVTTPIVYNYKSIHDCNYILNGKNIVSAIIMLINDKIVLPLSLFSKDYTDETAVFSELPYEIKRRLYNATGVIYEIKGNDYSSLSIISNILKYS